MGSTTAIAVTSERFRSGWPLLSRAVIVTSDCEAPSWVSTSGLTVTVIDVPSSEGPVSDGVSVLWTVHAVADARIAIAAGR